MGWIGKAWVNKKCNYILVIACLLNTFLKITKMTLTQTQFNSLCAREFFNSALWCRISCNIKKYNTDKTGFQKSDLFLIEKGLIENLICRVLSLIFHSCKINLEFQEATTTTTKIQASELSRMLILQQSTSDGSW